MNKAGYILVLSLLCCLTVQAQTYEKVFRNNFWNSSDNVTGIRQDTVSRSFAEAYATYEGGGFRDTWQAPEGWSAGAVTASIRHMEKISLAGSFSFEQTEGYDMCGSMFIKPGFYPVDVLEFTPGRKTLQTYAFDGGISYDLSAAWRIGAKMDFESANMAKRKDLRHGNWRLDMKVSPGFMYHNDDFAIGASYIFRKTGETIEAEQLGTSESSYYAFLDKGMMYGIYSVWSGSGLHLHEAGVMALPVKDFSNGAALQMQYKGLFAEVEYLRTSGVIGEKEYIWFRFPGNEASASLGYRHQTDRATHFARVELETKNLGLDESILEKVSENGVTTVYNHGSNRILASEHWSLSPEYEFVSDLMDIRAWADMEHTGRLSSQMYPYAYHQSIMTWKAGIDMAVRAGGFEIEAEASYGEGKVSETEKTVSGNTGVLTSPFRLQEWYERQMEFQTASRINAGVSLRYNFLNGIYLKAGGAWAHGFGLIHMAGADRFSATFRIGYEF
ncbi:MAG: hypothetical protein IJN52_01355 [Bacteroidales bacterium]|nr:hypothetical protein [Bacteroidales bacterium]